MSTLAARPRRKSFIRKWRLKCRAVADSLEEAGERQLGRAASRQYQYAARDVRACASLAPLLPEEAGLESHEAFMARLRREHPRKVGFWSLLKPAL